MLALVFKAVMRRVYRDIAGGDFRLVRLMSAPDVTFVFPGSSSFSGTFQDRDAMLGWLERFAALHPQIEVHDVAVSGPLWNMRVAVRFDDTIGDDYRNQVLEMYWLRWGRLARLEAFLDTERIVAWEQRHPELIGVPA